MRAIAALVLCLGMISAVGCGSSSATSGGGSDPAPGGDGKKMEPLKAGRASTLSSPPHKVDLIPKK